MKVSWIWVGLLFFCCGGDASQSDAMRRIIGGHETTAQEHPYMVEIQIRKKYHSCGGTLIHPRMVLTAAHCKIGAVEDHVIRFGTSERCVGGITRTPTDFLTHPNYVDSPDHFHDDIAVVIFEDPVPLCPSIQTANLPVKELLAGEPVNATGWGHTIPDDINSLSDILNMVELEIIDHKTCIDLYNSVNFPDKNICAGNPGFTKSTCIYDSGGPLVNNGTVYGVTAWSIGCAQGYPDVYTDVLGFKDFILEKMKLVE